MTNKLKHVAIIMDGNGRWAHQRKHRRIWGHVRGAEIVNEIVEEAQDCGVKTLTLFAFSTENWSRPFEEIKVLFVLLRKFLKKESERIFKNNIKFKVIGKITGLPVETQSLVLDLEEKTKNATGLELNFAFDYGGRLEILDSVNRFIQERPGQKMEMEDLEDFMFSSNVGDVDLLIRTGGDQRVSNFLLWQIAYAELYFTDLKWPDFSRTEFRRILSEVSQRERRFGSIEGGGDLSTSVVKAGKNRDLLCSGKVE